MSKSTSELYGSQNFKPLKDIGAIKVYELHIEMLENQLEVYVEASDFKHSYEIQKSQDLFRRLIRQVLENS